MVYSYNFESGLSSVSMTGLCKVAFRTAVVAVAYGVIHLLTMKKLSMLPSFCVVEVYVGMLGATTIPSMALSQLSFDMLSTVLLKSPHIT